MISALLSGLIEKTGLPQVAVFLGLGAVIGPFGLNLVNVNVHSPILRVVGTLSLVLVLFTDAVSLNLAEVRKQRLLSFLVIGPGTLFSGLLIAFLASWMLGLAFPAALVLGAALASTDPVMLRALLGRPGLNVGVRQALRLEGGMNDAVLLPMVLVGMTLMSGDHKFGPSEWAHFAMSILVLSPAGGVVVGLGAVGMLELVRRRLGVRRDYESIYSLGVAFAAYAAAESVHGSGFLAAFAAGVTISALDVELCDCFLEYGETTAEMALMFTFVLFGMSVIWTGFGVGGGLTILFVAAVFAARPAAFLPALLPARLSWHNRWLVAWFGPRGLSSLLLVLLPVFQGLPQSEYLLRICCLVVMCSVVLHGISPIFLVKAPRENEPDEKPSSGGATAAPVLPLKVLAVESPAPNLDASEYITVPQIRQLQEAGELTVIVDARTDRTYEESGQRIPSAVRIPPDRAASAATGLKLPQNAVLAVLCA
ncbi:MAG: hypothetical protein JWP08_3359 [Bryobacterales bacterium]|nr:hypothetical protein [Bryobacterales bacterium]